MAHKPRFDDALHGQSRAELEGTGGEDEENTYSPEWWRGFDLFFIVFMASLLLALMLLTYFFHWDLFTEPRFYWPFWLAQVIKVLLEWLAGFFGGLLVLRKNVKVNYTRKIQHGFAYLFPLLSATFLPKLSPTTLSLAQVVIGHVWGYFFVLIAFFVLIYPLRMRVRPIFVAFACLDRPEDRPYTLKWIVSQIVLGYVIIETFKWVCAFRHLDEATNLIYVIVLTVGVGDGLAEPVGIRFGRHKYRTRAMCSRRRFTRSIEGSAMVFGTAFICVFAFWHSWGSYVQVIVAAVTFPILMSISEAIAPHTWDTPVLFLSGSLLVFAVTAIPDQLASHVAMIIALSVGIGGGLLNFAFIFWVIRYIRSHPVQKEMKEKVTESDPLLQ